MRYYYTAATFVIGCILLVGASCTPHIPATDTNSSHNSGSTSSSDTNNPNILPCTSNAQCISGKLCSNGACLPAEEVLPKDPATGELLCSNNDQCWNGKVCVDKHCVVPSGKSPTTQLPCNSNEQCVPGKLCVNNQCVPAENVLSTDPTTGEILCSNDDQCFGEKLCIEGRCVSYDVVYPPEQLPSNCREDSQCSTGSVCFQGRCTTVPTSCNSHAECLSDDLVCYNHTCVWPGPSGHTCQNAYAERWHCLNTQTCGQKLNECV